MNMLEPTPYHAEFISYLHRAKQLQDKVNLGGQAWRCGDDLMDSVSIYDTVNRRHAGFSNVLMDLFHGRNTPKWFKKGDQLRCIIDESYVRDRSLDEWLYLWIVHRVTGSGASFEADHGYRNTPMFEIAKGRNVKEMSKLLVGVISRRPIFTSIGNQPPMFAPTSCGTRPGAKYLTQDAPILARDLAKWLHKASSPHNRLSPRQVVDWMNAWNIKRGMKRFTFQYAAVAGDLADYAPKIVDPDGDFYHGKNAVECSLLIFNKPRGMKMPDFLDWSLRQVCDEVRPTFGTAHPYDIEDGLCDGIRWLENYVPGGGTYAHLCMDSVWNSCSIANHPKGRQKAMLDLGLVKTFNDRSIKTSDHAVLDSHGLHPSTYMAKVNDHYAQQPRSRRRK